MLSARNWKLERVAALWAFLVLGLSVGVFLTATLKKLVPDLPAADEKFCAFAIGTMSFHGLALLLTHLFLKWHSMDWREFLGLGESRLRQTLLLALAVTVCALPMTIILNNWSEALLTLLQGKAEMQPTMKVLEISIAVWQRVLFAFSAMVVAPLAEEVVFRGILYPTVKDLGFPNVALFGSAFLFSAIHGSLMTLGPLFFLAIILTLLYERTGTLLAPIAAHSLFNTVNFFMFILTRPAPAS